MGTIIALSFDFDGCLYTPPCLTLSREIKELTRQARRAALSSKSFFSLAEARSYEKPAAVVIPDAKPVSHFNTFLIASIHAFKEEVKAHKTVVFIGSARQDKWHDDEGHRMYGLRAFDDISDIVSALDAEHDPLLLADIYGELEPGTSFQRATNKDYHGTHAPWINDKTKFSILYAQMHKIATEHPDDTIEFTFMDDREDILYALSTFFSTHPELVPANVRLQLNRYNGLEHDSYSYAPKIEGTGATNPDFADTIRLLVNLVHPGANEETSINLACEVGQEHLDDLKAIITLGKLAQIDHSLYTIEEEEEEEQQPSPGM